MLLMHGKIEMLKVLSITDFEWVINIIVVNMVGDESKEPLII